MIIEHCLNLQLYPKWNWILEQFWLQQFCDFSSFATSTLMASMEPTSVGSLREAIQSYCPLLSAQAPSSQHLSSSSPASFMDLATDWQSEAIFIWLSHTLANGSLLCAWKSLARKGHAWNWWNSMPCWVSVAPSFHCDCRRCSRGDPSLAYPSAT